MDGTYTHTHTHTSLSSTACGCCTNGETMWPGKRMKAMGEMTNMHAHPLAHTQTHTHTHTHTHTQTHTQTHTHTHTHKHTHTHRYVLPNHMLFQISEQLPREAQGVLACCTPIPTLLRQQLQEVFMFVHEARQTALTSEVSGTQPYVHVHEN